jgi:signal recognition particle receptor subunit beta
VKAVSEDIMVKHGESGLKIVFFGPSMAGKTSALSIFHAIKKREDPEKVYEFLKLEDKKTERTIGFDHAVFGLGDGSKAFKYHLFTVPGQDRFAAMRKVVSTGLHGLIIVIDASRTQWEANQRSLKELFELLGEKITNGEIAIQVMLNKMDLPEDQRITPQEAAKLLVESGVKKDLADAQVNIIYTSCLEAVKDLAKLLKEGSFDPQNRPQSIQRIVQPIQMIIRDILIKEIRKKNN